MKIASPIQKAPFIIVIACAALILSGCSSFDWLTGKGKNKEGEAERYDDAPLTQETGEIPADSTNARHSDKETE